MLNTTLRANTELCGSSPNSIPEKPKFLSVVRGGRSVTPFIPATAAPQLILPPIAHIADRAEWTLIPGDVEGATLVAVVSSKSARSANVCPMAGSLSVSTLLGENDTEPRMRHGCFRWDEVRVLERRYRAKDV